MLATVIRFAKRFAVLVPGLIVLYLSIFDIYPRFRTHLPLVLALIVTYILGAYLLIPALIRLARIFSPSQHLPLYCVTPDGFASDPINIGLIGTRQQLIDALTEAGWFEADRGTPRTVVRQVLSTIYGWSYPNAPMSKLYLFGRPQDAGFQIPIPEAAAGSRHHVRFWATTYSEGKRLSVRSIHWHKRSHELDQEQLLWVGAASRDVGVAFIRHNAQVTHMIDPDTNSERKLIIDTLDSHGRIDKQHTVTLGKPYKVTNRVWRGYLQTDGKMAVVRLKSKTAKTN